MTDYALLVFDWDGTLVDSIARIVDSMKAAARETALPERDDTRIKGIIGLGLPEAIAALSGGWRPCSGRAFPACLQ